MRKSVTKTIKATVAFAMAIGAGVGAAMSNRKATPLNAEVLTRLTLNTATTTIATSNQYNNQGETSTAYHWAVTCGSKQTSGLWLGSNNNQKSKMTLGNGSYSDASGIATACGVTTSDTYYAAIIQREGTIANVDKVTLTYTTPGGTSPSEAWVLFNTGSSWSVFQKVTSLSPSGTDFEHTNVVSARYAFVIHSTDYCQFKAPVLVFKGTEDDSNHTVTFHPNNGEDTFTQSVVDKGNATTPSPAPLKTGYTLNGWYDNAGLTGEVYNFNSSVTGDFDLYAKWDKVAETANYSPSSLTNGTEYRISGEVTAITSDSYFFIQNDDNVMQINGSVSTYEIAVGNFVDLYGTYRSSSSKIDTLVYCDKTSNDTEISQTPITSLNGVTNANRFRYFNISQIQLSSGFANNKASIMGSEIVIYYYGDGSLVNNGSFVSGNYSANDYVSVSGVVSKYNSEFQLVITNIQKLAQYSITFNTNGGSSVESQNVLPGGKVSRPNDPTKEPDEYSNYTFVGWYSNVGLTDEYDFDAAVNSNITIYAKWNATDRPANESVRSLHTNTSLTYHYTKNEFKVTDSLTYGSVGVSGTTYNDWDGLQDESEAVYLGNSAGDHDSIQLRSKNSTSGIVTTSSGGKARKITVVWNDATQDNNKIDIYGKNTAYTAATQLYGNSEAQGTKLGSIEMSVSTELTISGDYAYIGIRSYSGAVYLESIDIAWDYDDTQYIYSNAAVKFGGQISTALWSRLNTESHGVLGYGVMLAEPSYLSNNLKVASIEQGYDLIEDAAGSIDASREERSGTYYVTSTNIKYFYNPVSTAPTESNGNYVWNLVKNVNGTDTGLTRRYTAVAFVRTTDDGIIFLSETTKSAAQVAAELMAADPTIDDDLGGSMANLAGKYVAA